MTNEGLDPSEFDSPLDDDYVVGLSERWAVLQDAAAEADDPAVDAACVHGRTRLVEWLINAADPDEAQEMLAAGIADLPEDLAVEHPDLAEYLLKEAGLLCRILGSVPFVQLVLELAEQFYQTLPQAVIRALDQLNDQLRSNPALAEVIVAGGSFGEIAMLTGQAWLELQQAAQARASFLTAYATRPQRTSRGWSSLSATAQPFSENGSRPPTGSPLDRIRRGVGSDDVDPDFIESAAEFLVAALGERLTSGRPAGAYDRYREVYLTRPEWIIPITGRSMYLTTAAEIVSDRGDFAAAWDLILQAEAAWDTADSTPEELPRDELRAELALTKTMTAFDSGRIELAIRTVRESVAGVPRQPGSAGPARPA